jgi:allantoin racemase
MRTDSSRTVRAICAAGKAAVEQDGAQALVLGCLGMAGMAAQVQEELGVPVIDPAQVAIRYAELIVGAGLTHSLISYPLSKKQNRLNDGK